MTWRVLRRNHTESAVAYEKSLKPFMKALDEGDGRRCQVFLFSMDVNSKLSALVCSYVESVQTGPLSLPHLVPLLRLMEGDDSMENSERGCQLLYSILQSSRYTANHANEYQQYARTLLSGTAVLHISIANQGKPVLC